MQIMMKSTRLLLQEAANHQKPDPCVQGSLHDAGTYSAALQNASTACQHAYAYVRHHEGSPIPYLLAGLAAMLALIGISLFILACSYWKLVGCVEQHAAARAANYSPAIISSSSHPHHNRGNGMLVAAAPQLDNTAKLVVIMAGQDKPTFIAQPVDIDVQLEITDVPSSTVVKV